MAVSLKHGTLLGGTPADDPAYPIGSTEWDQEHTLTLAADRVLGRLSTAGAVQELTEANLKTLQGFPTTTTATGLPKFSNTTGGLTTCAVTVDGSNNLGGVVALSASGSGSFGVGGAATASIQVNGPNTGTAAGSGIYTQNAGTITTGLGNKSSILGGVYSGTPYLYGSAAFECNVGMIFGGLIRCMSYTVAGLPAGAAGDHAWASNGRAMTGSTGAANITVQGAGAGTGVLVTKDASAWKLAGTNSTVVA